MHAASGQDNQSNNNNNINNQKLKIEVGVNVGNFDTEKHKAKSCTGHFSYHKIQEKKQEEASSGDLFNVGTLSIGFTVHDSVDLFVLGEFSAHIKNILSVVFKNKNPFGEFASDFVVKCSFDNKDRIFYIKAELNETLEKSEQLMEKLKALGDMYKIHNIDIRGDFAISEKPHLDQTNEDFLQFKFNVQGHIDKTALDPHTAIIEKIITADFKEMAGIYKYLNLCKMGLSFDDIHDFYKQIFDTNQIPKEYLILNWNSVNFLMFSLFYSHLLNNKKIPQPAFNFYKDIYQSLKGIKSVRCVFTNEVEFDAQFHEFDLFTLLPKYDHFKCGHNYPNQYEHLN